MSKPVDTASTATPVDALAAEHAASLNSWCAEVLSLRAVAKSFDAQADAIFDDKVKPLLASLGLTNSIASPSFTLVYNKGKKTLNAAKLLENGVAMSVIEASKTTSKPSWGLRGKDDDSAPSTESEQ